MADHQPEWKKRLLLKKRAEGKAVTEEAQQNVVPDYPVQYNKDEDLRYGPGIVDRLRARFSNIGVQQPKPVRRFCSLENLPGSQPYRVNVRLNTNKFTTNSVKKAQSMETLLFPGIRRPLEPCRPSGPKINENELPKPDTVKLTKKLFEPASGDSENRQLIRKKPTTSRNGDVRLPVSKIPLKEESSSSSAKVWPAEINCRSPTDKSPLSPKMQPLSQPPAARIGVDSNKKSWNGCSSVVFDFRGRSDIEPHISITPTPCGSKPPAVAESSSSTSQATESSDEEYWDDTDIGADLPAYSGIVFTGENVKIGRGAFLETRNKQLNIQFDDDAISTFEYPSENCSSPPPEENNMKENSFNSVTAMNSIANSRLGLSNYTPQNLCYEDFKLGVTQSKQAKRSSAKSDDKEIPIKDVLIPAGPSDTVEWSANEAVDILF